MRQRLPREASPRGSRPAGRSTVRVISCAARNRWANGCASAVSAKARPTAPALVRRAISRDGKGSKAIRLASKAASKDNRAKDNRAKDNRAKDSRARDSRARDSKAKGNKAKGNKAKGRVNRAASRRRAAEG